MAFEESAVKTVIEVLHDGERGFSSLSEHVKEPTYRTFFFEESATRSKFAAELEAALSIATGKQIEEGGTASGAMHRAWAEAKAHLGGSDHTLLETAEQGEDVAKKAYQKVLEVNDLPNSLRALLATQQTHINASHDKVKAMRDSLKIA